MAHKIYIFNQDGYEPTPEEKEPIEIPVIQVDEYLFNEIKEFCESESVLDAEIIE